MRLYYSNSCECCRFCGWTVYVVDRSRVWCGWCHRAWRPIYDVIAMPC